jgi:hypothetical protein
MMSLKINKIRGLLYFAAKILGDINGVRKGEIGQRVGRRVTGKVTGRLMGKIFK